MLGTYASLALILGASAATGQALFGLCGRHEWSWLSPAVGISLLIAVAFGGANLAGDALGGIAAVVAVSGAAAFVLQRQGFVYRGEPAALPTVAGSILLGSLPFVFALRYGILGTDLNPDMSQHLFAADRLGDGGSERLVDAGYPLGPHALVASIAVLGPSLVHGFGGLTVAIAVAASLAPLAILRGLGTSRLVVSALLVGFAYLAASFLIQGAFKETFQALVLVAFAIALAELAAGRLGGPDPQDRWRLLGGVPLAALAVGSVYAYSFPGLVWIVGGLGLWALVQIGHSGRATVGGAAPRVLAALIFFGALVALEVPRMLEFASFETFDPDGEGLGNLFAPISPLEALGVWPSGDFRLDPGAGFAPAIAFWAGGALAALALVLGLIRSAADREFTLPAFAMTGTVLYVYAAIAGTPYQEAKALVVVAPLIALIAVPAAMRAVPPIHALRDAEARGLALPLAMLAFLVAAAGCSVLALANGPVGPSRWTPALIEFGQRIDDEPVLAVADEDFLADNGADLIAWELRGREVCVVSQREAQTDEIAGRAYGAVVIVGELDAPLPVVGRLEKVSEGDGYALFDAKLAGPPPECPFIADGDRARPAAG